MVLLSTSVTGHSTESDATKSHPVYKLTSDPNQSEENEPEQYD